MTGAYLRPVTRPGWRVRALAGVIPVLLMQFGAVADGAAPPRPAVTVAPVITKNVAPAQRFIGHIIAIQAVKIVPRVTAFIDNVPVKQGSNVKAGQVIYELQKAQYEAAVESAQAQLASATAAQWQAQLAYGRAARLSKQGFEAQANLDQALATLDEDKANVQAAQANQDQAQLNLSYCTIASPIAGRIGAITLTKGNLVTPSTPALATVNQLDPIRVVFSVSDRILVTAERKAGVSGNQIGAGVAVNLELPDGSAYSQTGKVAFISNQVDTQTGTVGVYADFANPDGLLLPGGYVTIEARRAKPEERPLVPIAAVQTQQSGSYVLVVSADDMVTQRPVTLGRQIAQDYIVEKGLSGGERVITAGVQKVHPGETVNPTPAPAAPQTGAAGDASTAGQSEQVGQGE